MIHFTVDGIECVTDARGKTLGIDGTLDVKQLERAVSIVRQIKELGLERLETKGRQSEMVEIKDVSDLPPD